MKKIKVLFMQSQEYFGADSRIHADLMRYLDRDFVEVHVALNYGADGKGSKASTAIQDIPDIRILKTQFGPSINNRSRSSILQETVRFGLPFVGSMVRLINYTRRNKIQIVHGTEKPRDAIYGYMIAKMTGARFVTHLHVKAENWINHYVRLSMYHANGLISISNFVAQSLINMGYDQKKIYTVLNGLNFNSWNPSTDPYIVRKEFNIPTDRFIFVIASRLFFWKGHKLLLAALAKVKEINPNFTLFIVGDDDERGAPGQGLLSEELKALIKPLGLEQQVIFTGFRSDVQSFLAACDIFTHPSYEEPFGMVFTEAMAMKKPVIALNNGGTPEVIEHGKSGLLSEPEDVDGLAANILKLMNDPQLRQQMGEYGRSRVENYFSAQRMADNLLKVYQMILN